MLPDWNCEYNSKVPPCAHTYMLFLSLSLSLSVIFSPSWERSGARRRVWERYRSCNFIVLMKCTPVRNLYSSLTYDLFKIWSNFHLLIALFYCHFPVANVYFLSHIPICNNHNWQTLSYVPYILVSSSDDNCLPQTTNIYGNIIQSNCKIFYTFRP